MFSRLVQIVALLFGLIYLRQTYDQKGVMNINGSLFLLQAQMTFGTLFAVLNVCINCLLHYLRAHTIVCVHCWSLTFSKVPMNYIESF